MPTVNNPRRPWMKKPEPKAPNQGRENPNRALYGSWKWRNTSKRYLTQNPLCVKCRQEGRLEAATVTDHIVPVNAGSDPYDESNFQGLCLRHHQAKSANERHGK